MAAFTLTTDYSYGEVTAKEVTAPKALKHGDTIKYTSGSTGSGWRQLTDAPIGTVLRSPKGHIVIREAPGAVTTYYSHNGGNHVFQDGTYTVLDVPKPEVKPDATGDLAAKLAKRKFNGGLTSFDTRYTDKDVEWTRKDKGWRTLAEFIRTDYVKVGTSAIVDNYGDLWFKGSNGKYSLSSWAGEGTRDRAYISREYGIKTDIVIG